MALPLSDMLTLAQGDDNDKTLQKLQAQAHEAATYLLNHAEGLLIDETVKGRVIVAELAVFETHPGDDQDRQFATFAAARAKDQLDSYLECIQSIQTVSENGGPLVLMDDFYKHNEAFLSMPEQKVLPGRQAAVSGFVGKFDTPRSQLSAEDRQALKTISPQKRFEYFAEKVANDLCADQWLSIAAVTLDCSQRFRARNIRASLFVVLCHESNWSTNDGRLRSLISQRTYKLLGSLVAGNLLRTWADQDKTHIAQAKRRIFPQGDPRPLGYKGADFKAFFQDDGDGPQGGPPHNLRDDPLHHDVRHYFAQIFSSPCQDATEVLQAEIAVDEWAKREGQAELMHELMKQIFLRTYDLTLNWLTVLAASCLKLDTFVHGDNPRIQLFKRSEMLSDLQTPEHREAFANALIEFFSALKPKELGAGQSVEITCDQFCFELKVSPFNALAAEVPRRPLIEKLHEIAMEPSDKLLTGDLYASIQKIHKYLRLSGLIEGKKVRKSKQICVFQVIPAHDQTVHSCTFRFQSLSQRPGGR